METSTKKGDNLQNVSTTTLFNPTEEIIEVSGVKIETVNKCCFCNAVLMMNNMLTSVKYCEYNKRQLTDAITKSTKTELIVRTKDAMVAYIVQSEVMNQFNSLEMPNDDRELMILNCKKFQVTCISPNSRIFSQMKKIK